MEDHKRFLVHKMYELQGQLQRLHQEFLHVAATQNEARKVGVIL